jgi:hypothetical protein
LPRNTTVKGTNKSVLCVTCAVQLAFLNGTQSIALTKRFHHELVTVLSVGKFEPHIALHNELGIVTISQINDI